MSNNSSPHNLRVENRPVSALKPDPKNARLHGNRQIKMLVRTIEAVGFNAPILIDLGGNVIAGHARLEAAKQLKMQEVPTICLEHLTEAQIVAFKIADNRIAELSVWDDALLAEQLQALADMELDFNVEATGFTVGEIDLRIEREADNENDPADEPAPMRQGPAITKLGDLWLLDRHRLDCGNALEEESYHALMKDRHAAMAMTDPPFNISVADIGGLGAIKHREFAMASGEMSKLEFTTFLTQACTM